jgi:hypothetical protein
MVALGAARRGAGRRRRSARRGRRRGSIVGGRHRIFAGGAAVASCAHTQPAGGAAVQEPCATRRQAARRRGKRRGRRAVARHAASAVGAAPLPGCGGAHGHRAAPLGGRGASAASVLQQLARCARGRLQRCAHGVQLCLHARQAQRRAGWLRLAGWRRRLLQAWRCWRCSSGLTAHRPGGRQRWRRARWRRAQRRWRARPGRRRARRRRPSWL